MLSLPYYSIRGGKKRSIKAGSLKFVVILAQQWRRFVKPGGGLRKMHRGTRQLDLSGGGMLAFPDVPAPLDMRIVENLADGIDGASGNTARASFGWAFICATLGSG